MRSVVQVYPGPPRFLSPVDGGIAQLGERVLCKHEVVGSIPSASTNSLIMERIRNTAAAVSEDLGPCVLFDIVKRK